MKNKKWYMEKEPLVETDSDILNPERGFYEIYNFDLRNKADFDELKWCLRSNQSLVLLRIDISAARDGALSDEQLEYVDRILDYFDAAKKNIILRFVYDTEGKGNLSEPDDISIIIMHIRQLGNIVKKYSKNIFVFQGLLIGSWGEMHTSAYSNARDIRRLAAAVSEAVGDDIFMAVRKPSQLRSLIDDKTVIRNYMKKGILKNIKSPYQENKLWNVGLFDDGMFGSISHLGTFGNKNKKDGSWDEMWCPDDELEFENNLCDIVPNGGEALLGEEYVCGRKAVEKLQKMQVSYLNCAHDKKILDKWKGEIIEEDGLWKGMSYYDYISRHLGYRIVIRNVKFKVTGVSEARFNIEFENVGFAPLYDEVEFCIMCCPASHEEGESNFADIFSQKVPYIIKPHEQNSITVEAKAMEGDIFLALHLTKYEKNSSDNINFNEKQFEKKDRYIKPANERCHNRLLFLGTVRQKSN